MALALSLSAMPATSTHAEPVASTTDSAPTIELVDVERHLQVIPPPAEAINIAKVSSRYDEALKARLEQKSTEAAQQKIRQQQDRRSAPVGTRVDREPTRQIGHSLIVAKWGEGQWPAFDALVMGESGWNNTAQNPGSTAFGIGQFLNSTWQGVGCVKTTDPEQQVICMMKYVEQRYGTPAAALAFKKKHNWY